MINITCTSDPISGKDIEAGPFQPFYRERGDETDLTIYFESDKNRRAWLAIPVEHPVSEHNVNRDNPTDEYIDEG